MPVQYHADMTRQPVDIKCPPQVAFVDSIEESQSHGPCEFYRWTGPWTVERTRPDNRSAFRDSQGRAKRDCANILVRVRRVTLGRMQNPVRGFVHGVAALASVAGLGFLLERAWSRPAAVVGALVFGIALAFMYTVSSLYHSVPWDEAWKLRLQKLDHSMIYLVVAGTFTPIAIAALDGASLAVALTLVWVLALAGILLKTFLPEVKTRLSVTLQLIMGWLAVIWMPQIYVELGVWAVVLIAVGGLCYTLGVIIFTMKRPRLFPRAFSYHEVFHVLVVAGSAFHFTAILIYAIPATV